MNGDIPRFKQLPTTARIELPSWLPSWWTRHSPEVDPSFHAGRMALIGELALENVRQGGGPFSAGVWDLKNARWISAGVNLVLSSNLSCAHAEIVALALAQTTLGAWNLGDTGRQLELVSSAEPCAMCAGAVPWSGIISLIFGASGTEAEAAGFDEGAKPRRWKAELTRRGIQVAGPLKAEAARQALREFARLHTPYNGRPRPETNRQAGS